MLVAGVFSRKRTTHSRRLGERKGGGRKLVLPIVLHSAPTEERVFCTLKG